MLRSIAPALNLTEPFKYSNEKRRPSPYTAKSKESIAGSSLIFNTVPFCCAGHKSDSRSRAITSLGGPGDCVTRAKDKRTAAARAAGRGARDFIYHRRALVGVNLAWPPRARFVFLFMRRRASPEICVDKVWRRRLHCGAPGVVFTRAVFVFRRETLVDFSSLFED